MHAYRMLGALGDELLLQRGGPVVTRHSGTGDLAAVLYHYPDEVALTVPGSFDTRDAADRTLVTGSTLPVSIRVEGLPPRTPYRLEVVDADHGSAMAEWERLGSPLNLSRADAATLRAKPAGSAVVEFTTSEEGVLDVQATLRPWSVALLTRSGVEGLRD